MIKRSLSIGHRDTRDRKQKETHSEIERKRRERMKRETEFLQRQLPHAQCRDKLSVFQVGAETLIKYTDKLGKRDYILNDEEYSQVIMNQFEGFHVHIRCANGEVMSVHENVSQVLHVPKNEVLERTIYALSEPSSTTQQILTENLKLSGSEVSNAAAGDTVGRNFIIAMCVGPSMKLRHCVRGMDGKLYRFVEFCGDIVQEVANNASIECDADNSDPVLRALCRPLDPGTCSITDGPWKEQTVAELLKQMTSTNTSQINSAALPASFFHFTLRLNSDTWTITEAVGHVLLLLGCPAEQLIGHKLVEFIAPSERSSVSQQLQHVLTISPTILHTKLTNLETNNLVQFSVRLTSIHVNQQVYCVVAKFTPSHEHTISSAQNSEVEVKQSEDSQVNGLATLEHPSEVEARNTSFVCCGSKQPPISRVDHIVQKPEFTSSAYPFKPLSTKQNNPSPSTSTFPDNQELDSDQGASIPEVNGDLRLSFKNNHVHSTSSQQRDSLHVTSKVPTCIDLCLKNQRPDDPMKAEAAQPVKATEASDDWLRLPINSSFQSLLNFSGLSEDLFQPDYLSDLLQEDVTDI